MARPQLIRRTFSDFDELSSAAPDWDFEYNKLDSTPFKGQIDQLVLPGCAIHRGRFSGRHKQKGSPPKELRTFAIFTDPQLEMVWRGQDVDGGQFAVFPKGGELDCFTEDGFDMFTISVSEESLFSIASELGFQTLEKELKSTEVIRGKASAMQRLRKILLQNTSPSSAPILDGAGLEKTVLLNLIGALETENEPIAACNRSRRRRAAVRQVDEIILAQSTDPPKVKDLCRLVGVSERTLEYAFSEYCGLTPKTYINAMRLNGVRRKLRTTKSVADAANAWGFWHMGQLARDYRNLFGELPSDTLIAGRTLNVTEE